MSNRPSLIIAFWICVAFVAGRLLARFLPRTAARVIAIVVAAPLVAYVFWAHITWHAAVIPVALVIGTFTYGQNRIAPGVFDETRAEAPPPSKTES